MAGFLEALETLGRVVPKIKGPIQLAALVFSVFAGALIYKVDPNNIVAISIVGAVGVALIAIPLAFHSNVLVHLPTRQRVWFLLALVILFLCSFGALAYVTVSAIMGISPQGPRFDSRLDTDGIRFIKKDNQVYRVQLTWQLFPLSDRPQESASVFVGMVSLHDEDAIVKAGLTKKTGAACKDVSSCVGSEVFRELDQNPLLVRAGSTGTPFTVVVDLKRAPQNLRVWWVFYQLEGLGGDLCRVSRITSVPADGVPQLAMFNRHGTKVGDACYRSFGQQTFTMSEIERKE